MSDKNVSAGIGAIVSFGDGDAVVHRGAMNAIEIKTAVLFEDFGKGFACYLAI